jgi:hypothetical protein
MGMDVFGKKPTDKVGKYFRRNVWGWRPLWDFCLDTTETASGVRDGHSNSGYGLNKSDSLALAEELRNLIADGSAEEYISKRNTYLSTLERPDCKHCAGTGIRKDAVAVAAGQPERELSPEMAMLTGRTHGWCNGCGGEGKNDAWETNYFLDLEDVKQFADFLENCGGFKIC